MMREWLEYDTDEICKEWKSRRPMFRHVIRARMRCAVSLKRNGWGHRIMRFLGWIRIRVAMRIACYQNGWTALSRL